jgi:hypothetical protein
LAVAASTSGQAATLAAAAPAANYAAPQQRAADLGLPAPASRADAAHRHCAADTDSQYPVACFPTKRQARDYIAGTPQNAGATITLAGFGGTSASTTGNPVVGVTCTGSGCTGTTTTWWSTTGSNCTHAYPYNDYYRNNVSTFYYAQNLSSGLSGLNCNRMVLYRDGAQSGAGALDCGNLQGTCGSGAIAYQSISWHNG